MPISPPATAPARAASDQSRTEVLASGEGQMPWGSFHLATVMFHRARQLRDGSRPRVDGGRHKPVRIALLEVTAGVIPWELQGTPGA